MTQLDFQDLIPPAARPINKHPTALKTVFILFVSLALSFTLLISFRKRSWPMSQVPIQASPFEKDGGDCEVLGPLRPVWARPDEMRAALPEFKQLYKQRPILDNGGGMRFDHAFALWYTLRALHPPVRTIIESGAFRGQGTWLMRETLPRAAVFSLDPASPKRNLTGVRYLTGEEFVDFNAVDWRKEGVDVDDALVFFDDHQSGFRRVIREGMRHGFWRFIAEDNYPYPKGDNMSFKWVCELTRKSMWPGVVHDNFSKIKTNQTWEEHLKLGEELRNAVKTYYEFPPVATSQLTEQTRFDETYTSKPLLNNEGEFREISTGLDKIEFQMYTHFSYIETRRTA